MAVYHGDYRAMSDVYTWATYATVYEPEHQRFSEVLVNANFECDTSQGRAEVDATPEVLELRRWHQEWVEACQNARNLAAYRAREEAERNRPVKGKKMVVVSGRKVKPGTEGTVAYVGDGGRVLLKPDHAWEDRKTDGVWVQGSYLKAR